MKKRHAFQPTAFDALEERMVLNAPLGPSAAQVVAPPPPRPVTVATIQPMGREIDWAFTQFSQEYRREFETIARDIQRAVPLRPGPFGPHRPATFHGINLDAFAMSRLAPVTVQRGGGLAAALSLTARRLPFGEEALAPVYHQRVHFMLEDLVTVPSFHDARFPGITIATTQSNVRADTMNFVQFLGRSGIFPVLGVPVSPEPPDNNNNNNG